MVHDKRISLYMNIFEQWTRRWSIQYYTIQIYYIIYTVYAVYYTAIHDTGWLTKYSHPHFFSSYNEFISVFWFSKNMFSNSNIRFLYSCSALSFRVFRIEWVDKTLFFSGGKNYLYTLKCLTNFFFLKMLMCHLYNSKL